MRLCLLVWRKATIQPQATDAPSFPPSPALPSPHEHEATGGVHAHRTVLNRRACPSAAVIHLRARKMSPLHLLLALLLACLPADVAFLHTPFPLPPSSGTLSYLRVPSGATPATEPVPRRRSLGVASASGGGWDDDEDVRFSGSTKHIDTGFLKVCYTSCYTPPSVTPVPPCYTTPSVTPVLLFLNAMMDFLSHPLASRSVEWRCHVTTITTAPFFLTPTPSSLPPSLPLSHHSQRERAAPLWEDPKLMTPEALNDIFAPDEKENIMLLRSMWTASCIFRLGREGGREGGRKKGGREGGRKGGREGGREGGRKEGRGGRDSAQDT